MPVLLGPDGQPWRESVDTTRSSAPVTVRFKSIGQFYEAIQSLGMPPTSRALNPFKTHAWVYAAASAIAKNISQASFGIYQETDGELQRRKQAVLRSGRQWTGPQRGHKRTAVTRHLNRACRKSGVNPTGVERFTDHPLTAAMSRPNPYIQGSAMLWYATIVIWVAKGECAWLLTGEGGARLGPAEIPSQIWPVPPECLEPIVAGSTLVGWRYNPRRGMLGSAVSQSLTLAEVVQLKFYNPDDPLRGLAPIAAAMAGIELDMLSMRWNRSTLINGANPGGIVFDRRTGGTFKDTKERQKFEADINERHSGPENVNRMLVLDGFFDYQQTGMTPKDMEHGRMREWDRDEVLATLSVPKSVLSINDGLPYASAISQDFNFWDKCLFPIVRLAEDIFDETLLNEEPDSIVGMFDTSTVQALRAGVSDKIATARSMCGTELHAPPRVAYDVVGLDVPAYDGDDVALVSPMVVPSESILDGGSDVSGTKPTANPGEDPQDPAAANTDPSAEPGSDPSQPSPDATDPPKQSKPTPSAGLRRLATSLTSEIRRARSDRYWGELQEKVCVPMERVYVPVWRRWVRGESDVQLQRFDAATRRLKMTSAGVVIRATSDDDKRAEAEKYSDEIIVPTNDMTNRLARSIRPTYVASLENVYAFTAANDFAGVTVFEFDDPPLMNWLDVYQRRFVGQVSTTIQKNLRSSLVEGFLAGETRAELRQRVSHVYDVSASSAKSLSVARTEAGAFANGGRDVMFTAQGMKRKEWITAGGEHVRESHATYGEKGVVEAGFDFLTIRPAGLGAVSGKLRYPHDPEAPASEVVNCRCNHRPLR